MKLHSSLKKKHKLLPSDKYLPSVYPTEGIFTFYYERTGLTMEPDFKKLNERFPNRNWGEIYRRIQNGEPVATSLKMAIDRYTPDK